jgi:hypothetical protein
MISYRQLLLFDLGGEPTVPDDRPDRRAPTTRPAPPTRSRRFDGMAADGLVTVTVSETGELLGVHVSPGDFRREDPPGLANMGDMVVEALRVAKTRAADSPEDLPGPRDPG